MSRLSKAALTAFVAATLAGSCLHFFYELLPSPLTACFAPVNESLWEHLKLLYWPYLVAGLILARREGWATLGRRSAALLLLSGVMLAAGYLYHVVWGGTALFFDVALYVLLMAGAFLLPQLWKGLEARRELLVLLAAALGAAILLFTFLPPGGILFRDLSLNVRYGLPVHPH